MNRDCSTFTASGGGCSGLPAVRGHLLKAVTCQNEVTCEEKAQTADVQQGVQAGGSEAPAGQRQAADRNRSGARCASQRAAWLGGDGRGRGEDRPQVGGADRARAAAQGQGAAARAWSALGRA